MVLFNYSTKEITAKIVYYGPGLCGKTTNLQYVHSKLDPTSRGKLLSLATEADRTLFFDFLPLDLGKIGGFHVRFQLYTVPGQVHYNATRRMVLKGVDAVVFVADSQVEMMEHNRESFQNLAENLVENGYQTESIPIVLQANKRDLPNIAGPGEIIDSIGGQEHQIFEAVACQGDGVFDTLRAIITLAVAKLREQFQEEEIREPVMDGFGPPPPPAPVYEPKPLFNPETPMMAQPGRQEGPKDEERGEESSTGVGGEAPSAEVEAPLAGGEAVTDLEKAKKGEEGGETGGGTAADLAEVVLDDEIDFDEDGTLMREITAAEEWAVEEAAEESAAVEIADEKKTVEEPIPAATLLARVEELALEVDRLREENRAVRDALEKIFSGIDGQIAILKGIRSDSDRGGGERAEMPVPDAPSPETDR